MEGKKERLKLKQYCESNNTVCRYDVGTVNSNLSKKNYIEYGLWYRKAKYLILILKLEDGHFNCLKKQQMNCQFWYMQVINRRGESGV